MTIVFCLKSKEANSFFQYPLLKAGYQVKGFIDSANLLKYLEKNEAELLIIDYDDFCSENKDLLPKIRVLSENIQIIIYTLVSNFEIKNDLVNYKIYGVVPKPTSYPKILDEILVYIENIEGKPTRSLRKHPRVALNKKIHNVVKLVFNDLKTSYLGKIENISLGGFGIYLRNEGSEYVLFEGKKVDVFVELETIKFSFQGVIANFHKKRHLGISFFTVNPHHLAKIKDYILDLMLHSNENIIE